MNITYFDTVFVAIVIQHAKRMRRIVICHLFGHTPFFSDYLLNGTFWGEKLLNIKCAF